ncbi:MAG: DUF3108 domain-containing protein [Rhodospirillaceae bacterium]|nr:DUF3108 domain-containing protein [Rhodospirillales bacterium]
MRLRAMLLALTIATPAWAPAYCETIDPVEVRYEMFWGGFRAAEARLVRAGTEAELVMRATGMADTLAAFAMEAETQHNQFRSHSRSKSMESTLAVDFHGTPRTLVDEIRRTNPDDNKEPRPPVPEALKAGTMDPLTAMITASRRILSGHAGERFTMPVYDGRNRYDAVVTVGGPGSTTLGNRRITGTRATIAFKPLAGFRKKSQELWDGATFTLLLDPTTQLPARIVSDSFTIATVISAVPPVQKTGG